MSSNQKEHFPRLDINGSQLSLMDFLLLIPLFWCYPFSMLKITFLLIQVAVMFTDKHKGGIII
jgi:hypothetical protein